MTAEWTEEQMGTHQDHVVAHVIGATVLGWFAADDAIHLALDIGFIWTIYADAGMGLVPESLALKELNLGAEERARLSVELQALRDGDDWEAASCTLVVPVGAGCLIEEVRLLGRDDLRRLEVRGEQGGLAVEMSTVTGEMSVEELTILE